MLNLQNIFDTIDMIDKQHLDIRTITMGISLLDCVSEDANRCCQKIYDKICRRAEKLVRTGEDIESEFGIPIVNKRISVTPMALVAGSCDTEDYVPFALTLDRAAHTCGVNFIGGYSALVQKGFTKGDELLLRSIPQALAQTELVCSSVNVGSTRAGINMDAVARMGRIIKETAHLTRAQDGLGCAKLVVFCKAVEDFTNAGIGLCLDDFGSGYANLNAVLRLPFDVVKMDRSLLTGITCDEQAAVFYHSIVTVMQNMGYIIVAEGAETEEEVKLLREWGVDMVQGYYFSRPLPETELLRLFML